jgi:hypothetical membrane protein
MRRMAGFLGIGAFGVFWLASFVLGAIRPDYSHVVNTISELGAVGTPNAILWNIIGFIVPGIFLAIAGGVIAKSVNRERSNVINLASVLLILSGLAVAGQGIFPAEMKNGMANTASISTLGHFLFSLLSGAGWVLGALLLVRPMKRSPDWHGWHFASIILVVLTLIASLTLRSVMPDGLAQRTGNIFFLSWFLIMSVKLLKLESGKFQ